MSKLQRAIQLIKEGDADRARQLLTQTLDEDPGQEVAWLWMTSVVDSDERRAYCLRRVLDLNPTNQLAQDGLAALQADAVAATLAPEPAPPPAPEVADIPTPAQPDGDLLVEFVVERLAGRARARDVVYEICEKTGMSWSSAEALVRRVQAEQGHKIAGRQRPLLVLVGVIIILAGTALFFYNFPYVRELVLDPGQALVWGPYTLRRLLVQVVSMGLVLGGAIGLWRAFSPQAEELFAGQDTRLRGRQRYESVDDLVDVGVWLVPGGDDDDDRHRRRRRRIRLL
ncbi:MAG: hypothetical protein PVF47_03845 [Anaerolineae bacterium]|jgi:hypothetical protein